MSEADRISIQALLQAKLSGPQIARKLNFSRSTINREINREINRGEASPCALSTQDQAGVSHVRSRARQCACGFARRKLGSNMQSPFSLVVLDGLRCHWSPEQISSKLLRMKKPLGIAQTAPTPALPSVSHETIDCAIYAMARNTLRTELVALLRHSHKTRLPRARGTAHKAGLPNMTNISLRPPEAGARIVPGHKEGDLIKSAMNRSTVGTLLERISRSVMLVKLEGNTAQDVLDGFKRRLRSVPESLRKTLTLDQGSETALHEKLSADLNIDIFFCDPHRPWQRGFNENANGVVRKYLPRGTDLSKVTHQQLAAIEHSLSNRPRKILYFHSPYGLLGTDCGLHPCRRTPSLKSPSLEPSEGSA